MRPPPGPINLYSGAIKLFKVPQESAFMMQKTLPLQPAAPDMLAWLASQVARGCTRASLFKALLDAGWTGDAADNLLQLTAQERLASLRRCLQCLMSRMIWHP